MLVLTRKPGESVKIGDETTVTVVSIDTRSNTVRLGFDSPIDVYRTEVYEKIVDDAPEAA